MGRFIVRRLLQGVLVIFLVTVVVFVTTRLVGDPVDVLLPFESTPEQRAEFKHQLGLDRSIPVQFWHYMGEVVHLDFGQSLVLRENAMNVVLERLPATVLLVSASLILAFVVSMTLGVIAALRPGGWFDRLAVISSLAALSMPEFWVGLLLIYLFSVELDLLPSSGKGGIEHLILPAVTMAFGMIGRMVMVIRSSMLDELSQPYMQTARAKGLSGRRSVGIHAMRNVSVPVLTLFGWELILALAGYTAVVETVVAWPGIGFLAYNAIVDQDLIVLQSVVFVVAILVVLINITIDILYKAVDPRIQLT
jgi:peptide/nickel transport system permease protein